MKKFLQVNLNIFLSACEGATNLCKDLNTESLAMFSIPASICFVFQKDDWTHQQITRWIWEGRSWRSGSRVIPQKSEFDSIVLQMRSYERNEITLEKRWIWIFLAQSWLFQV